MDTQQQIFGLVEAAQEHQRTAASELAALKEAIAQVVPAVQQAAGLGVADGLDTAQRRLTEAVALFDRAAGLLRWRLVGMLAAGAAGCIAAVLIAGWISLTWQRGQVSNLKQEKAALLVEVADLKATADKLTARGGQAALTMCTINPQKSLPCVRVNADHGSYGDKAKGVYYVIYGY